MYLLAFHACINEMHGSRSKIPSKKSCQRCAEGLNSGVKGLMPIGRVELQDHSFFTSELNAGK
jgi:hypothetical protein